MLVARILSTEDIGKRAKPYTLGIYGFMDSENPREDSMRSLRFINPYVIRAVLPLVVEIHVVRNT